MAYTIEDAKLLIAEVNKKGGNWPTNDQDFIQAVTAWLNHESGPQWNPLGIMRNGQLVRFENEQKAFEGVANLLATGKYGYDKVIIAGRTGDPQLFLTALAQSSWSGTRYGYPKTNNLIRTYNRLFGENLTIPSQSNNDLSWEEAIQRARKISGVDSNPIDSLVDAIIWVLLIIVGVAVIFIGAFLLKGGNSGSETD